MLVAPGASQPSPFDHARPHHAPSDGSLSPAQTAAAADMDMEGAAAFTSAAPVPTPTATTPDAPAPAATPTPPAPAPALPDATQPDREGALPVTAADLNPAATVAAANGLPSLDAPIALDQPVAMSVSQPLAMGLAMDMTNMTSMPCPWTWTWAVWAWPPT